MLEFLYKGDYSPKIAYDKKRASWFLDDDSAGVGENVVSVGGVGGPVLKDTVIYVRLATSTTTHQHSLADEHLVLRPPLQPTGTPTPRPQKARSAIRRAMQHYPLLRPLRLLPHAGLGQ